ncbi:hypothetical protein [Candidatus Phytoplasma pini]|uniref:Uncharacterized protein n=1 Tax=Candidatus Phytoplasma pini TaxID=267362 RepID=A0A559KK00_9MOLU|nr:hypothetical protein [Candidatus Phytoplasma pini]TVY12462.1 hypothetical protein MDPP_0078 [Candidatus Phytoplasma pini]
MKESKKNIFLFKKIFFHLTYYFLIFFILIFNLNFKNKIFGIANFETIETLKEQINEKKEWAERELRNTKQIQEELKTKNIETETNLDKIKSSLNDDKNAQDSFIYKFNQEEEKLIRIKQNGNKEEQQEEINEIQDNYKKLLKDYKIIISQIKQYKAETQKKLLYDTKALNDEILAELEKFANLSEKEKTLEMLTNIKQKTLDLEKDKLYEETEKNFKETEEELKNVIDNKEAEFDIDKEMEINNKFNRSELNFQKIFQKYKDLEKTIKNFFKYIFQFEETDNKIEKINFLNNQLNTIKNSQNIFLIILICIIISYFYIIFIINNKKNLNNINTKKNIQ